MVTSDKSQLDRRWFVWQSTLQAGHRLVLVSSDKIILKHVLVILYAILRRFQYCWFSSVLICVFFVVVVALFVSLFFFYIFLLPPFFHYFKAVGWEFVSVFFLCCAISQLCRCRTSSTYSSCTLTKGVNLDIVLKACDMNIEQRYLIRDRNIETKLSHIYSCGSALYCATLFQMLVPFCCFHARIFSHQSAFFGVVSISVLLFLLIKIMEWNKIQ